MVDRIVRILCARRLQPSVGIRAPRMVRRLSRNMARVDRKFLDTAWVPRQAHLIDKILSHLSIDFSPGHLDGKEQLSSSRLRFGLPQIDPGRA